MKLNISIENFYKNKTVPLAILFTGILCAIFGSICIIMPSPYTGATYFTYLNVMEYLDLVFSVFYWLFLGSFVAAHISFENEIERKHKIKYNE